MFSFIVDAGIALGKKIANVFSAAKDYLADVPAIKACIEFIKRCLKTALYCLVIVIAGALLISTVGTMAIIAGTIVFLIVLVWLIKVSIRLVINDKKKQAKASKAIEAVSMEEAIIDEAKEDKLVTPGEPLECTIHHELLAVAESISAMVGRNYMLESTVLSLSTHAFGHIATQEEIDSDKVLTVIKHDMPINLMTDFADKVFNVKDIGGAFPIEEHPELYVNLLTVVLLDNTLGSNKYNGEIKSMHEDAEAAVKLYLSKC